MYRAAEYLIEAGLAYVDEQSAEEMRVNRGDFSTPGTDSPFRSRTLDENLQRFRDMRDGKLADGATVLRAKIDMASPTSTCATRRCTASAAPRTTTPATSGASTRCTPMRTRSRMRWRTSPTASARWSSKTSARSTTGCWTGWPKAACSAQPHPRQYEFARLNLTYVSPASASSSNWWTKAIVERLGRPAHAHHRRPAPPRLHAREPAAVRRAHRRHQGRRLDRLQHRWKARCATTWTRRRRARWRCSTR